MRYLITGGAGFIGSYLAERLLEDGHTVEIIDNLSTGSFLNIEHLVDNGRFSYLIDTIINEPLMAQLIDKADVVFHLAAAVGVKLIVERPVDTIETNIHGTEIVLKLADKKKKKVILTSTSEVYGKNAKVPFKETDDMVLGPTSKARWSYACSKAIDEFLGISYFRERNLPVIIARLFNTVGPRQVGHYGMVIPRFVQQALEGGPITVYDDGLQARCFVYVTDVVDALIKLSQNEKAVGDVFNIGSNEEITIKDLAHKVRDKISSDIEITYIPYSEAYQAGFEDMRRRVPDISKVAGLIGFAPTVTLDEILDMVIAYIRKKNV